MTEDDAKTKWCPFARVGSEMTGLGSINRDIRLGEKTLETNCIGSACMAWRGIIETVVIDKRSGLPQEPGAIYLRGHSEERLRVAGGYCGLAGAVS